MRSEEEGMGNDGLGKPIAWQAGNMVHAGALAWGSPFNKE